MRHSLLIRLLSGAAIVAGVALAGLPAARAEEPAAAAETETFDPAVVDSFSGAFLAARTVGPEDLLAVTMPYRTSDPSSETDAQRVIDTLGCDSQRIDLTPFADPLLTVVGHGDEPDLRVRRGNVLARLRKDEE